MTSCDLECSNVAVSVSDILQNPFNWSNRSCRFKMRHGMWHYCTFTIGPLMKQTKPFILSTQGGRFSLSLFFLPKISFSSPDLGNPSRCPLALHWCSGWLHFSLARWDKLTQRLSHFLKFIDTWPLGGRKRAKGKPLIRREHPFKVLPSCFEPSPCSPGSVHYLSPSAGNYRWNLKHCGLMAVRSTSHFMQTPKPNQDVLMFSRFFF